MVDNAARVRGSLSLLLDPTFGWFFASKTTSVTGMWIHNIVAAMLAFDLSGSALTVGLVSVAQFGPQLLLAPLSGALADRLDRRRQTIAGQLIVVLGAGSLAVWLATVGIEGMPGAWPVVGAAFIVGLGFVISGPAQNALIPALVSPNELPVAISLNAIPPTVARAIGPAIGASVTIAFGPAVAFGITAVAVLTGAMLLLLLRISTQPLDHDGNDRRVRAAFVHLRADGGVLLLLVGVTAIGVGADPVITLSPSLSAEFAGDTSLVGQFAASFGVGAVAAFLVLRRVQGKWGLAVTAMVGLVMMTSGMGAAALAPTPWVVVASFATAGIGMTLAMTSLTTQLQARSPEHLRGRIMALWALAFFGSRPVAAAINGGIADMVSVTMALLVVAGILSGAAWLCRPTLMGRHPAPAG